MGPTWFISLKNERDDAMKTMLIAVGLPRSGKSTHIQKSGYPIVNRDSIRLALHGQPYIQDAESMVTAIEDYMVDSLFLAGHDIVSIDACHTSEKRQDRWIDHAKQKGYKIIWICFRAPEDVCIGRAIKDGREDLVPVIERMSRSIFFPEGIPNEQISINAYQFRDGRVRVG